MWLASRGLVTPVLWEDKMEQYADGEIKHMRFLEWSNLRIRTKIRQAMNCGFIRHVDNWGVFTSQQACLRIVEIGVCNTATFDWNLFFTRQTKLILNE
jgi:hypothetical protein